MKILILFFLCFISGIISGQVISSIKMDKVIIDSHLSDPLFTANKHVKQKFTTVSVVATDNSGNKKDSSTQVSDEMDVIINSKVTDVDWNHYPFDSCTSFFKSDTLVIFFLNTLSLRQVVGCDDKLIVNVVKNKFFTQYLPVNSSIYESPYELIPLKQKLILKKPVFRKGDRLRGRLKIQFVNHHPEAKVKFLTLEGPFDCIVQ
jgi:hypothetical protein